MYLDPKWLSRIDHGVLVSILRFLLFLICRCYRSRRRARFMFSSPSFPSNTLRCEGRSSRCMTPLPESRAEPREGERRCLWSPGLLGGLAGGRVRARNSRGIPKKKSCILSTDPVFRVLIICNSTAGEIGSEKRPPYLELSNLLFNLIAPRVQFSYKSQLFFNDSENHIKSSLRTRHKKKLKNISKTNVILTLLVFFESLENSKTSVKPI